MHMVCSIYIASLFILNHVFRLIFFFIFTICINLEKCIRTLKVSWSLKYILFGLHVQWTFHSSNRVGQQTHLAIASWQFVIVIFHPKSLITNKEVVKIAPIYKQRNTLCCSKMSHFCYSYMIVMHLNISALSNMFCPCLLCSYFASSFFLILNTVCYHHISYPQKLTVPNHKWI